MLPKIQELLKNFPEIDGTLVADILNAIEGKQVPEDIPEKVSSGERIVGELNNLEKALLFLCQMYSENVNLEFQVPEPKRNYASIKKNDLRMEATNALMWANIQERLTGLNNPQETNLGLRSGYKIAAFTVKNEKPKISATVIFVGPFKPSNS